MGARAVIQPGILACALTAGVLAIGLRGSAQDIDRRPHVNIGITSFQVHITQSKALTVDATIFIKPLRAHYVIHGGPATLEFYVVDGEAYTLSASGWNVGKAPSATPESRFVSLFVFSRKTAAFPNAGKTVVEDGITYGSIEITVRNTYDALPGAPSSTNKLVCTFDTTTYFPHECVSDSMTETFSNYNDPANTVELPADAAKLAPFPTPTNS